MDKADVILSAAERKEAESEDLLGNLNFRTKDPSTPPAAPLRMTCLGVLAQGVSSFCFFSCFREAVSRQAQRKRLMAQWPLAIMGAETMVRA